MRRRPQSDFDDEIQAHLAIEADGLVADGMDPEDARLEARRAFGSVAAAGERFYESHRWLWLDRARQDVRDGMRSLVRYPVASLVAILSIAAGMGITAATLTVRDVVFHRPPAAYADPGQLSEIRVARGTRPLTPIGSDAPGGLVARWIAALGPTTLAAARPPQGVRDVRTADRTESVSVRAVTPELFDVLGVRPVVGRTFAADAAASLSEPAMLSYRLWQQWFDSRADVVGQTIWIENHPHTIVGVLPRQFWMSALEPAVWTALDRASLSAESALEVIARRPPGMTLEALRNTLQPLMAEYALQQPADQRQLRLAVVPVEGTPAGKQMSVALPWVLGIASLLTLLIACANVAILMIARWTARDHEIAIRASLGASRERLVRTLVTESMLVAVCGGVLGVGSAYALLQVLLWRAGSPDFFDVTMSTGILGQTGVTTLAAGLLIGIGPALLETRRIHGNPMRADAFADSLRQRWRHALVILEIGVTVALLVVASAFVGGYRRMSSASMGFPTRPLMSARVQNSRGVPIAAVIGTLTAVPGVASAAASTTVPFIASGTPARAAVDASGTNMVAVERGAITPAFFSTLGVAIESGRAFTDRDTAAARVAIVNRTLAERLFGSPDAVGRRVYLDAEPYDVVGVSADFENQPFFRDHKLRVLLPMALEPAPVRAAFVIRAAGDPAPLVATVRRAIRDAAPGNVVTTAFTIDAIRTIAGQEILVGTAPLAPLILIGMMLTMAGLYGVLTFAIARRSRELAVRIAIGATGRDLVTLVSRHTARLVAAGAFLGVGLTFALTRIVRASGGAGSPFDADWTAFAAPVAIMSVVAALATWAPSRRVRRIDPAVLLRSET